MGLMKRRESEFFDKLIEHIINLGGIDNHKDYCLLIGAFLKDAREVGKCLLLLVHTEEVDILT